MSPPGTWVSTNWFLLHDMKRHNKWWASPCHSSSDGCTKRVALVQQENLDQLSSCLSVVFWHGSTCNAQAFWVIRWELANPSCLPACLCCHSPLEVSAILSSRSNLLHVLVFGEPDPTWLFGIQAAKHWAALYCSRLCTIFLSLKLPYCACCCPVRSYHAVPGPKLKDQYLTSHFVSWERDGVMNQQMLWYWTTSQMCFCALKILFHCNCQHHNKGSQWVTPSTSHPWLENLTHLKVSLVLQLVSSLGSQLFPPKKRSWASRFCLIYWPQINLNASCTCSTSDGLSTHLVTQQGKACFWQ